MRDLMKVNVTQGQYYIFVKLNKIFGKSKNNLVKHPFKLEQNFRAWQSIW